MEEIIQTQNSSKYLTLHLQVSEKNLAAIIAMTDSGGTT